MTKQLGALAIKGSDSWSYRDQIDFEQSRALIGLSNAASPSFFIRAIYKYKKNFYKKSPKSKLRFLLYCGYVVGYRIYKESYRAFIKLQSRLTLPPRNLQIAISCTGALGDMMHHIPFIENFYHKFGPFEGTFIVAAQKTDVRSSLVISALPFMKKVISENIYSPAFYDLLIEIRHIVKFTVLNQKRLSELGPSLASHIQEADSRFSPFAFVYDNHPHLDGFFGRIMQKTSMNAAQASGYFGNIDVPYSFVPALAPNVSALKLSERFGFLEKRYIVFHDGFEADKIIDANIPEDQRIMRSWPLDHWNKLASLLKQQFPDYLIVQVGISKTSHVIANVDVNLLDKTNMQEVCWILKHASLHVDTESGLMRLAWAMSVPTISLQGPSGTSFFSFYGIKSIISATCNNCYWVKENWNSHCLRELEQPECMISISPERVMVDAINIIKKDDQKHTPQSSSYLELGTLEILKQKLASVSTSEKPLFIIAIGNLSDPVTKYLKLHMHDITIILCDSVPNSTYHEKCPHITYRFGSPYNVPFQDKCADIVIFIASKDKYQEKEAERLVKKGGMLFEYEQNFSSFKVKLF